MGMEATGSLVGAQGIHGRPLRHAVAPLADGSRTLAALPGCVTGSAP
jgi:hypothetical protein